MKVHQANLPQDCKPVTVGWQFSRLVVLPAQASSWTYGLDAVRIPTTHTPGQVGAAQLAALVSLLALRLGAGGSALRQCRSALRQCRSALRQCRLSAGDVPVAL